MNSNELSQNRAKLEDEILMDALSRLRKNKRIPREFYNSVILSTLEETKKIIFIDRFLNLIGKVENKQKLHAFANNVANVVITIGSLLTPALLSIRDGTNENIVFFGTWSVALATGLASGLSQLFQLQKKHILFVKTLEKLISEGFLYLSCAGHYEHKSCENNFGYFIKRIEDIRSEEITNEFQHSTEGGTNDEDMNSTQFLETIKTHNAFLKDRITLDDDNKTKSK